MTNKLNHWTPESGISGIYRIVNIHDKGVYIGQSIDINHKIQLHFNALAKNKHPNFQFQQAYNTFSDSVKYNFRADVIQRISYTDYDTTKSILLHYVAKQIEYEKTLGYKVYNINLSDDLFDDIEKEMALLYEHPELISEIVDKKQSIDTQLNVENQQIKIKQQNKKRGYKKYFMWFVFSLLTLLFSLIYYYNFLAY